MLEWRQIGLGAWAAPKKGSDAGTGLPFES